MKFKGFPTKEEVFEKLFDQWKPAAKSEVIPLEEAVGRVLAEEINARYSFPVVRSSKGDGVAFCWEKRLDKPTEKWVLGEDYDYADTGDDFPDAFDTVVMVEEVEFLAGGGLKITEWPCEKGENVNPAGSTIKTGDFIAATGKRLRPTDLAGIALGGHTEVKVYKKIRIAFIPTGSELIPLGEVPQRGQMIDCNSLMVKPALESLGAEVITYPIVKDVESQLEDVLKDADEKADIVVINGGSAKGKEDLNARLLERMSNVICHGVKAAPGRPLCLAVVGGKPFLNLPGPPIATYFGLDWCISAMIDYYYSTTPKHKKVVTATLKNNMRGPLSADFLCRVEIENTENGYTAEHMSFHNGSLGRVLTTNGQHILKRGVDGYPAGSEIEVEFID